MENSKYFIMLSLFVLIGILIGLIFSFSSNSSINNNLSKVNPEIKNNDSTASKLTFISGDDFSNNIITNEYLGNNVAEQIIENQTNHVEPIKAVYLTGWTAGTTNKRTAVIESMKQYGFNAVVIDIKDEAGNISYKSNVQTAIDIGASKNMISDIKIVIDDFHQNDIYVIGRIVTFKDPTFAKNIPGIAYTTSSGNTWVDYSGNNWPNPYNTASWDYPISLAKEAAELGFDEIQFDYIRFPSSEGKIRNISYGFDYPTKTKSQVINSFLEHTMNELKNYDVVVSADVFGITTKKMGDFENIGQDFYEIAKIVDVICPMIYPSHYGFGEYGINKPDTKPYEIVKCALEDALKQYNYTSGDIIDEDIQLATIRPYLQDFTASWLKKGNYILYGTEAVTAQLQACYDLNIDEFILWDPSNKYAFEAINNIKKISVSGDTLENVSGD